MSLSRVFYEPFYSFADFDRLFDEAFTSRTGNQVAQNGGARALRPKLDLHEDAQANTVTATFELPGLKKEDVDISVHDSVLTVSGESKQATERDENGYAVRERHYGRFSRALPLPQGVKGEEVKASMENGVLTVTYPKSTPETTPKKITIA